MAEKKCFSISVEYNMILKPDHKNIKAIAEKLASHIDYGQLSRIERGISNPTALTILNIAENLQVPVRELFDFKVPKK